MKSKTIGWLGRRLCGLCVATALLGALTMPTTVLSVEVPGIAPLIPEPEADGYRRIEWDSLMPASYGASGSGLFDNAAPVDHGDVPAGEDSEKPIGSAETQFSETNKSVVGQLIGEKVAIPGFIVPLDTDGETVSSFLFVPYVGACVHVPPPPPNQLIYVSSEQAVVLGDMWTPMEIFGVLGAESTKTGLGEAGYTLALERLRRFEY